MEENLNALAKNKLTSLNQCGRQNNNPLYVHTYEYISLLGKREFAHVMKNEDLWLKNWLWILQVGSVYSCSPWEAEHLSQLWSKRKMWKGEKIQRAIVAWLLRSRLLTKECGWPLQVGRSKEAGSHWEPPEGHQPSWHSDVSFVTLVSDFLPAELHIFAQYICVVYFTKIVVI